MRPARRKSINNQYFCPCRAHCIFFYFTPGRMPWAMYFCPFGACCYLQFVSNSYWNFTFDTRPVFHSFIVSLSYHCICQLLIGCKEITTTFRHSVFIECALLLYYQFFWLFTPLFFVRCKVTGLSLCPP